GIAATGSQFVLISEGETGMNEEASHEHACRRDQQPDQRGTEDDRAFVWGDEGPGHSEGSPADAGRSRVRHRNRRGWNRRVDGLSEPPPPNARGASSERDSRLGPRPSAG